MSLVGCVLVFVVHIPVTLRVADLSEVPSQELNVTNISLGVRTTSSFNSLTMMVAREETPPLVPGMGARHPTVGRVGSALSTRLCLKLPPSPNSHTMALVGSVSVVRSMNMSAGGMATGSSPLTPSKVMPVGPATPMNCLLAAFENSFKGYALS